MSDTTKVELYEWTMPHSWMVNAINLYLGTITMPVGEHRCYAVAAQASYGAELPMFVVKIERKMTEPAIVVAST